MGKFVPIAALMVCAQAGMSQTYSANGVNFVMDCNASGFVLTADNAVAQSQGTGGTNTTIYLGKSCDTYGETLGTGRWCWGNGGFVASFEGTRFGFARQELYCPAHADLGNNCQC
ncbi:hypothetical protein [Microbulbifer sp. S227A]|uniref:hypothetical protein n=1 Tax=Microbulbifer sp. S227A TaxID=3415131 RepID=UPI003C7CA4C4